MKPTTVLCCLLLVLSGCAGGFGGSDDPRTFTPADVPGDRPGVVAPGVGPTGVTSALVLSTAHDDVVRNQSVSATLVREVRAPNGTLVRVVRQRIQVGPERERFWVDTTVQLGAETTGVSFWSDGERFLQAIDRGDRTFYGGVSPEEYATAARISIPLVPGGGRLFALLDGTETRRNGSVETAAGTLYRVETTVIEDPETIAASEAVRDVRDPRLWLLVDERGFVHEYDLRYEARLDGTPVTVTVRGTYFAVGSTTVERPPWYQTALERTGERTRRPGTGDAP